MKKILTYIGIAALGAVVIYIAYDTLSGNSQRRLEEKYEPKQYQPTYAEFERQILNYSVYDAFPAAFSLIDTFQAKYHYDSVVVSKLDSLRIVIKGQEDSKALVEKMILERQKAEIGTYSKKEIAKFAVSAMMGTEIKRMKSKREGDNYKVYYNRKDDGKYFDYKIKFSGNQIMWGAYDGRWRNSKYDEKLEYKDTGNEIVIYQIFNDGSMSVDKFKK